MYHWASNHIYLYDSKVHYVAGGKDNGSSLIMIHGLGGSWTNWALSLPYLMERHRCLALDLLGFGSSDKSDLPYSIPFYTDLIKSFMEALYIDTAVLIGHSMGGHIILDFCIKYPIRASCVVLVSPYGGHRPNFLKQLLLQLVTNKREDLRFINDVTVRLAIERLFYRKDSTCKQMVEHYSTLSKSPERRAFSRAFTRTARNILSYSLRHKLNQIDIPALIIAGRNDRVIPLKDVIYMERNIRYSKLVVMNHCGHIPQLEKPEIFARLVLDFLGHNP